MKLLPFNLQRALAGDKVVTRGGREVTQLTRFDCKTSFTVVGVMDGAVHTWKEDGRYVEQSSRYDLFMAPKTIKRWVNIHPSGDAKAFCDKQAALQHANWNQDLIAIAVPVEFEEGYGCE